MEFFLFFYFTGYSLKSCLYDLNGETVILPDTGDSQHRGFVTLIFRNTILDWV